MKNLLLINILIICLTGCPLNETVKNEKNQGGIIFTFDDQYVNEWHHFRNKFHAYNIKATFFINRPQNLTNRQIEKLKQLAGDGHEIGSHGLNHRNALDYKDSVNAYYLNDVLILHSHRIDTTKKNYVVNPYYLERVFRLTNKHGLKSIRICDLKRYFKDSS